MKNVLLKNSLKQIKNTRRRFISILVMALLGVGFFAGLYATGPDIRESLDNYLDNTNMYDINIVSTLGLTNEDVEQLNKIEDIEKAYGIKSKDIEITINEKEYVAELIDYNEEINKPILISGRLPQDNSECVMEKRFFNTYQCNIEDKIMIQDEENNFEEDKLTIVGVIESPLYISSNRGTTKLGSGTINCIVYTYDNFNLDYYSSMGIKVENAKQLKTDTKQYDEIITNVKDKIEAIKEERQNARYNELIENATEELDEAKKKFSGEEEKGEKELSKAEAKIEDGKKQIENAKIQLEKSKKKLIQNKTRAQKEFKKAQEKINIAKIEVNDAKKKLETAKEEYNTKKAQVDKGIDEINQNITNLENQKKYLESINVDTTKIIAAINDLQKQKANIQIELQKGKKEIEDAEKQIENAQKQIETNQKLLNNKKNSTNKKLEQAQVQINQAEKKIEQNEKEITDAVEKLEKSKKEFNEKIKEAQKKLDDSQKEIDKIEVAKWYILDRNDNTGYDSVIQAITSITNLSKVFPVVFYIIAILISLTSMTRMVEEERIEIGTLKALGYTNAKIMFKYILYAVLASVIGGAIGMYIGFKVLPNIIWMMYSLLYYLPSFEAKFRFIYGLIGIVIAFICIGGATFIVSHKELKNMPSVLMRPKAPKNGKRVILERIAFLWRRLKFSQKVTIRNLFRYKKRVTMTIIGIAGCTALVLAGFGLRDSIVDIVHNQYEEINQYDISVTINTNEDNSKLMDYLKKDDRVKENVETNMQTGKLKFNGEKKDIKLTIPEEKEAFYKVINLIDKKTKEKVELSDDGIIVTDKLAGLIDANVGDIVTIIDNNDIEYSLKIDGIVENYVDHYVYLSKDLYEKEMNQTYETNMLLINTGDISEEEKEELTSNIVYYKEVSAINLVSNLITIVEDMLSSLDYVVIVLIVSAALLAFVVLYNLANVNISERKREIATLKVLGFYDNEVDNYINKESIILTIIGIGLGLIAGYFLTSFLITTCEIEMLRFVRKIAISSYIYAIIITSVFTFIVNKIIHFILKKIDMIDSLKSIE